MDKKDEKDEMKDEMKDSAELSQPILNVSDVMSCLASDIDPANLSDTDIKTLISALMDHSRKVEAMKQIAVQILANRLN